MYLDAVKTRLEAMHTPRWDLVPCTEDEVNALEASIGQRLPAAYKEFLLLAGRGFVPLRGSDIGPFDLRAEARELLQENGVAYSLPADAFVFLMHQGYQFYFFQLSEGDDPPVYYYLEHMQEDTFVVRYPHFSAYLLAATEKHARYLTTSAEIYKERIQRHPDSLLRTPTDIIMMAEVALYDAEIATFLLEQMNQSADLVWQMYLLAKGELNVAEMLKKWEANKPSLVKQLMQHLKGFLGYK